MDTNFIIELYQKNKLIITIIIISTIYYFIYTNLFKNNVGNYINTHVRQLSSLVNTNMKASFITKLQNIIYSYFTNIVQYVIASFIKPFTYFIDLITTLIKDLSKTINKFRNMAQIIRNLFKNTVENTIHKISNSYASIMYLQEKLKLIIRKQAALFSLFKQFGDSVQMIMYSYTNGPIPKAMKFFENYGVLMMTQLASCVLCVVNPFPMGIIACPLCTGTSIAGSSICFDKNTPIQLDNKNNQILIKDIHLNNKIYKGGKITGIINILSNTDMYDYNGVIVSGSHLVLEKDKWIRVEKSNISKPIVYNKNDVLYCLINENNKIITNNITFADYQETRNTNINYVIGKNIIHHLNRGQLNYIENINDFDHTYYWGFSKNTMIKTNDGNKKIHKIKIGDVIENHMVIGTVKLIGKDKTLYNYKGVIVCGSQAVFENGIWLRVHQSKHSFIVKKESYIYHLIMDNNLVKINNVEFCDFCETNEENINNNIDLFVEKYKNNHVFI